MNNISNIEINGMTYSVKDTEAREGLKNCVNETTVDEKLSTFLSVETGTGTLSLQSKEWVGDEDEEPRKCSAEGLGDVSLGLGCYTNGKASIALGKLTAAPVSYATALGNRTTALGNRAIAFGHSGISAFLDAGITTSSTVNEIIATWLSNNKNFSLAKGRDSFVWGQNCLSIGNNTSVGGNGSISYGTYTNANGRYVTAISNNASAYGHSTQSVFDIIPDISGNTDTVDIYNAWLTNKFNLAFGTCSMTHGNDCLTLNDYSQAFGCNNVVKGGSSLGAGMNNSILAAYSAGFGLRNELSGAYSFITGVGNTVSGDGAAAFGSGNTVSGGYSFVAGRENEVSNCSNVLGRKNVVKGEYNSIFGYNNIFNSDQINHSGVLGLNNNINYGVGSFVVGSNNIVNYKYAHVYGRGLIANQIGVYLGLYNIDLTDSNLRFVIGKGTDADNRANLMEYRETKDTLDVYATDVKFTNPDGTTVSIYDLLDRLEQAEATIATLTSNQ